MIERTKVFFYSGGVRCAACLYRPIQAAGKQPCVVMGHGFSGTMGNLVAYAERFAAAGMAVLAFDYRYFGESGGQPRQLVDLQRQREDWRAAIRFARGCDGVDPERVALWGSSFSGGHVIAVAADDATIAAVIAQVPLIDAWRGGPSAKVPPLTLIKLCAAAARDATRGLLGRPPCLIPVFAPPGEAAQFTDPKLKPFFDALMSESSTWRNEFTPRILFAAPRYRPGTAERLKMPLLVCVADHDENASPSFAARVAKQAPRGELKRYPVGHFDVYPEMNVKVFEQVIADQIHFLRTHLIAPIHRQRIGVDDVGRGAGVSA